MNKWKALNEIVTEICTGTDYLLICSVGTLQNNFVGHLNMQDVFESTVTRPDDPT